METPPDKEFVLQQRKVRAEAILDHLFPEMEKGDGRQMFLIPIDQRDVRNQVFAEGDGEVMFRFSHYDRTGLE